MKGYLNKERIEYVLFHLKQLANIPDEIMARFVFDKHATIPLNNELPHIIFKCTEQPLNLNHITYINSLPILFSESSSELPYRFDTHGNLIFEHDFLKSAFYLLSGYQETRPHKKDRLNRYPYLESIQCKLGIIKKPLVNYYYSWIIEGINRLLEKEGKQTIEIPTRFRFILTHDIDSIDKYDVFYMGYKIKELLGLVKSSKNWFSNLKNTGIDFCNYLKFWNRPNPYWNFEFLVASAPPNTFRHIFFFLEKDQLHHDSYYTFEQARMGTLFDYLKQMACEIGLHGTVASSENSEKLIKSKTNLEKACGQKVGIIRQHRLHYTLPNTAIIQNQCKIKEDFTLGFAAHEGFRNSFCHPFKLYDFENEKMIDVWQYPLNVMDGTLFDYRKLGFAEAQLSIEAIINEIRNFGGVFTLLWHNSYLDEQYKPGITSFYKNILEHL